MLREGRPRHIVVGYDATEQAPHVGRAALAMRERFGCALDFVHAVDLPRPEDVAGRPDKVVEAEAQIEAAAFEHVAAELEGIAREVGSGYAAADHLHVLRGHPAQAILGRAEEAQADLVMIGPHHKRGFFDFGSTARAVLGKAPCDVWVQPGPTREVRRILVPTDLSEEAGIAIGVARDLAQELGASVTALHCFLPPDLAYAASPGYPMVGPTYVVEDVRAASKKEFTTSVQSLDWKGVEHRSKFAEGRPAEVVLEMEGDHDLIVMGSHGRTGLSAAVLGNVAYAVLKQARIPVLAIRQPGRSWLLA